MFKKILASIGKGAANVDLRLESDTYRAGEPVTGSVVIIGGDVEQKINSIEVGLFMRISHGHETSTHSIATIPVDGAFTISEKEEKHIPFRYQLPFTLPLSSHNVSFYFDTKLDIRVGVDKKDMDVIHILPAKQVEHIFDAMGLLGFKETYKSGTLDGHAQEFEFVPTTQYVGRIEEVEMKFALEDAGVYVWMEVDVQRGFSEKEIKCEFFLAEQLLEHPKGIAENIASHIEHALHEASSYESQFFEENQYSRRYHPHQQGHHDYKEGSSPLGMIGGVAAGIAGGMLLNEAIEHFTEDEDEKEKQHEEDNDGFLHEFFHEEDE